MPDYKSRRTRDAESARQAILNAAEEHFARYGFSGARIEAIAESAGYNKSLIFHYFTDKLGLYRDTILCAKRDQETYSIKTVMSLIEDENIPLTKEFVEQFIGEAIRSSFENMRVNPNLRRILAWEAAENWQTFRLAHTSTTMQTKMEHAVRFLRQAQAAGIVRSDLDPYLIISYVAGLVLAHLTSLPRYENMFPGHDFSSDQALDSAREQLVQLVLNGTMLSHSEATHATGL